MTDSNDRARLSRLQEIRAGMEALHAEALAERDGRTLTTEEAVALSHRSDLARPDEETDRA